MGPLSGNVSPKGKVTLNGKLSGVGITLTLKGTGYLTALGSELVGRVTLTGSGSGVTFKNEPFTLVLHAQ